MVDDPLLFPLFTSSPSDHMTRILPIFSVVLLIFVLALTIANTGELAYKSLVHWRPTVFGKNTSRNMQMLRFANEWDMVSFFSR